MKIQVNKSQKATVFAELHIGDVYYVGIVPSSPQSAHMKIAKTVDGCNCVNLNSGELGKTEDWCEVLKVNATLVVDLYEHNKEG